METVTSDQLLICYLRIRIIPLEFPDADALRSVPEKPAAPFLAEKRGVAVGVLPALGEQCPAVMVRPANARRFSDADAPVNSHIGHQIFVADFHYIKPSGVGNLKLVGIEGLLSHFEPVNEI